MTINAKERATKLVKALSTDDIIVCMNISVRCLSDQLSFIYEILDSELYDRYESTESYDSYVKVMNRIETTLYEMPELSTDEAFNLLRRYINTF